MSQEDINACFQQMWADNVPLDKVLVLSHLLNDQQWDLVSQRIIDDSSSLPVAWTMMAQHVQRRDPEQAKIWLCHAQLLAQATIHDQRVDDEIKRLAKKLDIPHPLRQLPDAETLEHLGFMELASGAKIEDRELTVQEPACFFLRGEDNAVEIVSVWISELPSHSSSHYYGMNCRTYRPSTESVTSGGMRLHRHFPAVGNVVFDAQQLRGEAKFRLRVEITPNLAVAR